VTPGARQVEVEATTTASIDDVWRVLADAHSYSRWVAGTAAIRCADPSWPAVGSRLHHRFGPRLLRVRDSSTVLECEAPRRLVLDASAFPLGRVRAEICLGPGAAGTQVVLRETARAGLIARLPRLGHAVQTRRNRRSLRALVVRAEHAARQRG
jgi:uncharacterized protein YndB with AHSA1/START domain